MIKPKIGLFFIYHPLEEGTEKSDIIISKVKEKLSNRNVDLIIYSKVVMDERTSKEAGKYFNENDIDILCVVAITWFSDDLVQDVLEYVSKPIITWGLPSVNSGSLCGIQQLDSVLNELNRTYFFIYGDMDDEDIYNKILTISKAASLYDLLKFSSFGLIGYRTSGMTEVTFDEIGLKKKIGPKIIHISWDVFLKEVEKIDINEAKRNWKKISEKVGKVSNDERFGIYSMKIYEALKKFIKQYSLKGFAVECYPDHMGEFCLPISLLADEGIVGGCEGDINSTVAMYIISELTGMPVHNTDFLYIYEKENAILYSHCGSGSFYLAENNEKIELAPVRLQNKGVCVLYPSKTGNVTLVNLVGRENTYRLCAIKGEAIHVEMDFAGNPIKVKMPVLYNEILNVTSDKGFGHHWMIGYGDITEELGYLSRLMKVDSISII